jgi:hypothetical protein
MRPLVAPITLTLGWYWYHPNYRSWGIHLKKLAVSEGEIPHWNKTKGNDGTMVPVQAPWQSCQDCVRFAYVSFHKQITLYLLSCLAVPISFHSFVAICFSCPVLWHSHSVLATFSLSFIGNILTHIINILSDDRTEEREKKTYHSQVMFFIQAVEAALSSLGDGYLPNSCRILSASQCFSMEVSTQIELPNLTMPLSCSRWFSL